MPASESQRGVKAAGRGMFQHPGSKCSFNPLNFQYANPTQVFLVFPNPEDVGLTIPKNKLMFLCVLGWEM